ncbi:cellulose binding domain-containing protein [Actinoplanes sp. CA-030573]|uniref:cellulose binding domain-containing protein n=1 Tax=Actinoplanes sp. CA-030573 TaxID=3239898 RepID=UPI003D8D9F14
MSRPRKMLASTLLVAALVAVAARPAAAALPAPGDLHVTAITPVSVTLSWTASEGATDYQVNYTQAFNDVYWSQPVGNVTTATITGYISPGRQYSFRVSAKDASGYSASSNTVTVVTPVSTTGDTTPPSAPGNLRITGTSPDGVPLAWDAAADDVGIAGYDVYFFDGWYTSTVVGSAAGTTFVAPFRSSSLGLPSYYVRARDAAGNVSIASNTVRGPVVTTTPPPPQLCTVAYKSTSEWPGGFVAEVTVTNQRTTAVDNWTLVLTAGGDQRVTSAWNATVQQAGATITLTGERWNRTIAAGGSVTAGMLGRWTASNARPTAAVLNGAACTVA